MKENALKLKHILNNPRKIVITTHRGPDGDAMGSSLAMMHFLMKLGHHVDVITPNSYADFLHWMPGNDRVIVYEEREEEARKITEEADLIFLMDFSHISRIADFGSVISNATVTKVLVDHHQDPDIDIADIIFSDPKICSTAQLVYELITAMGLINYFDKEIAECLYVGIMTDTGSFKYPSTNSRTHNIVAELIKLGANNADIHDLVYDSLSASRVRLLGYCLSEKLLLYPENNSAIISLDEDELKRFNFKKGDTEGIVNYALAIKGITFAAFIVEKDNLVKLSFRSKGDFKVNKIAKKHFNGGGHINAAGGVSQLTVEGTIKKIEEIIKNQ